MKVENQIWQSGYVERCKLHSPMKPRPKVGITGNYGERGCELARGYYQSVYEAGGTPLVIPPVEGMDDLESLLDGIDALLLSGGGDLNPLLVGEEPCKALGSICPQRDEKELLLLRMALDRQIPILGICRGVQLLAVATGGSVIQDLDSCGKFDGKLIKHSQVLDRAYPSHSVQIEEDSMLHRIFGTSRMLVNSFHHQAVGSVGQTMKVTAQSPDGVIEAIESTCFKSVIGVQWHPEGFVVGNNRTMMPLFEWLVGEARSYAEARRMHGRVLTLDTHCDTPMMFDTDVRFDERDERILVDLHKMREGGLDASIMAAYIPQKGLDADSLQKANELCNHLLDGIETRIGGCEGAAMAETPADLFRLKRLGKKAIMRGIENGYAIGDDITNVERFRNRGVVYMTLCHNGDNLICDSARRSEQRNHGVSEFGEKVIAEMNRLGMMVDLSHGAEESFWNALEISSTPIVCSHASCRAVCDHPRNLNDDQLRALARAGGVCQITAYAGFLRLEEVGPASIEDFMEHLNHAIDVMGIDGVGIGTDFDGDGGVPGLADASEVINVTRRLLSLRYSEEDIQKIWGGNFLRVMSQVQDAAKE